jgi:cell division septation protein DedD
MDPDTVMLPSTGVTAELYRAAIGPRGQDYYLKHFLRFDADGKTSATWHWPAYWTTLNWLIYRRMWGWALAYGAALLGLVLLIFGVGKLVFSYSDTTAFILFLSLLTAAFVVPGMYANAWFYNFCNQKISAVLRGSAEVQDACDNLISQAGSKQRWYALVSVNVALTALLAGVATFVLDSSPEPQALAQTATTKPIGAPLKLRTQHVVTAAGEVGNDVQAAPVPVPIPKVEPVAPPATLAQVATPVAPAVVTAPVAAASPPVSSAAETALPEQIPVFEPPAPRKAAKRRKAAVAATAAEPAVAPAAAPAPAVVAAPAVARVVRHWHVQVGAFSQESNAQSVRIKVEEIGFQTLAEPSDQPAGHLIRVRVGPFESKAEAEKAALRLRALELPTVLVRQ